MVEPLELEFAQAVPEIARPSEAMQWLNAHHHLSPITRHALVVLESIDAVDLAFDTFACALLDGEMDTSGYPEYNAVVGGVASHWDEATGDMIVRGVVGWGGKGVRGDTDRIGEPAPRRASSRTSSPTSTRWASPPWTGRSPRAAVAASSAPTAGSRPATSGRSTAPSAACGCSAADPTAGPSTPMPIYEYVCTACDHRTDILHGINDPGPKFCPSCGREGTMRKQFAPPTIHFKGPAGRRRTAGRRARGRGIVEVVEPTAARTTRARARRAPTRARDLGLRLELRLGSSGSSSGSGSGSVGLGLRRVVVDVHGLVRPPTRPARATDADARRRRLDHARRGRGDPRRRERPVPARDDRDLGAHRAACRASSSAAGGSSAGARSGRWSRRRDGSASRTSSRACSRTWR